MIKIMSNSIQQSYEINFESRNQGGEIKFVKSDGEIVENNNIFSKRKHCQVFWCQPMTL